MFLNHRNLSLCSFILIITFLSSSALFCSELSSTGDRTTPCFLETSTTSPVTLRTSGNSLVLPCHVAHSKRSTVEWWYTDAQKLVNIKIYPVYPPVRPTVLRFVTSNSHHVKNANETDVLDASILLRHVNVDDSGTYRCVIRPWSMDPSEQAENILTNDDTNAASLTYQVQSTAPRLCQPTGNALPCFTAMRTSSPTILDAYHSAFLQCVVKNNQRSNNVFWVVGDSSVNNVLITEHLSTNQHNGDRLRRIFPISPFDYSIEVTVNRTVPERVFSCVIDAATSHETTLFTYIVRTIDLESAEHQWKNATEKVAPHDTLNAEQVKTLHEKQQTEEEHKHEQHSEEEEENEHEQENENENENEHEQEHEHEREHEDEDHSEHEEHENAADEENDDETAKASD